jgi:hypothetical protein
MARVHVNTVEGIDLGWRNDLRERYDVVVLPQCDGEDRGGEFNAAIESIHR